MKENTKKSGNGTENNTNNVESNINVYRLIEKTSEQLTASAQRYNERAECGQVITFEKAEQKKAVGNAANADSEGYLAGIFWSGYVTTADGQRHEFERLDSNGISRHFADICTWKRATRGTLLDGNATRTAEQRVEDAKSAITTAKGKPAENSVTAMLWGLAEHAVVIDEENNEPHALLDILTAAVIETMEKADTASAEKAQSKESKTAQRERELAEAKQAAADAEETNRKMIEMLLATGQYKDENEIREKLGI